MYIENDPSLALIEELGDNVKSISYDVDTQTWTIEYKNGINDDVIGEDDFLDFLQNG